MEIVNTIVPIFGVILLGWAARQKGFIPPEFTGPANRLVFYVAIPAMVFSAIAGGSLKTDFNPAVLGCTLAAVGISFALTWGIGASIRLPNRRFGTFVQNSFHGNLGYIGLAVVYYYLGKEGLTTAGMLIGFVMIMQNLLSVFILQFYSDTGSSGNNHGKTVRKIVANPVILSAVAGICFSLTGAALPVVVDRTLDIIGGLALPLALLLIGASLNFDLVKPQLNLVLLATIIKLAVLPGIGLFLYTWWDLPSGQYVPGLILLASPSATISYVMAMEMNGDVEFAVTAISICTLLSAISFSIWLHITL